MKKSSGSLKQDTSRVQQSWRKGFNRVLKMVEHAAISQIMDCSWNKARAQPSSLCRPAKEVEATANVENMPEFTEFNISGTNFTVIRNLLLKYPESKLAAWHDLDKHWSTEKKAYYFDRDPVLFNGVLNIFRYDLVTIPVGYSEVMFKRELKFWNISWKELEVGHCIDLDEDIEKDFEWMEGRIPPPPASASIHAKRRYQMWCFLTDPLGKNTRDHRLSKAYALINIFLTALYLILFGISTDSDFRVLKNGTTTTEVKLTVCKDRLTCLVETTPVLWLKWALTSLISYLFVETLLRLIVCPNYKIYLKSFINCTDIIATVCIVILLPFYFVYEHHHLTNNLTRVSVMWIITGLLAAQALRIFKIFQYATLIDGLMVMVLTLKASLKELGLLFIYLLVSMFIFSTLVTFVELDSNEGIPNCLIGYWWAIITMTTVGYGDYYPVTPMGYIVGVLCAVTGLIMTALPVAVIGNNFHLYWDHNNKRNKIAKAQANCNLKIDASSKSIDKTLLKANADKINY